MSLEDYKSMASLYRKEGLLAEASQTYYRILQIEPQNQEAQAALSNLERDKDISLREEPNDTSQSPCPKATDDIEPVPIENLLGPLQEETAPPQEMDLEINLSHLPTGDLTKNTESLEEESVPRAVSNHELLADIEIHELTHDGETCEQEEDKGNQGRPTTDLENLLSGSTPRVTRPADEEETGCIEPSDRDAILDPPVENRGDTPSILKKKNQSPWAGSFAAEASRFSSPSQPDAAEGDPHLHYHLGIAYREMELTDKAITEFTRALDQGHNSLDCLIMLGRCHFEKGLFKEAATFIHQALELEGLTREQIDLLRQQLEDVKVAGKLD
jgi:tetratricopeptide (TPR) repeat protein